MQLICCHSASIKSLTVQVRTHGSCQWMSPRMRGSHRIWLAHVAVVTLSVAHLTPSIKSASSFSQNSAIMATCKCTLSNALSRFLCVRVFAPLPTHYLAPARDGYQLKASDSMPFHNRRHLLARSGQVCQAHWEER